METFSVLFFVTIFSLLLKPSISEIIVVDGLEEWKNPSVVVGDTIVFKHKEHYNLYIFRNRIAFNRCNFSQAVLLTDPKSNSFTWHPSRLGMFYFFFFRNGSLTTCQESGKLPIKVSLKPPENRAPSPELAPDVAPSPTSGGAVSSSPARQWHYLSPQSSASPSPATTVAPLLPGKGSGSGMPFINSNPAVPLPTDADAATIHPIPISGGVGQMVGLLPVQISLCLMLWMLVVLC